MADFFTLNLSDGQQYPYQIVRSKRAKYIRIKLSRKGNLSVTLPTFTEIHLAHEFIHSKKKWIEKNLSKVIPHTSKALPEKLDLKLLGESWDISYIENEKLIDTEIKLKEYADAHTLELEAGSNSLNDSLLIAKRLNQWLRKKSQKIFNVMLQELAELHGFHYQRLSIRSQKTRWGSCSNKKNINLNCKLLFMPEELVRYVMIHELCHTIEMNHSAQFWKLVEDCDPKFQTHKRELKQLGNELII